MQSNFLNRMVRLRDQNAERASKLLSQQLPNQRSLILRTRQGNSFTYREIIPPPIVKQIVSRAEPIEGLNGVTTTVINYDVKGVSKKFLRDDLEQDGIDFILGGTLRNGKLIGGIACEIDSNYGLQENLLTWDFRLQQRIGEQNLYEGY